MPDYSCYITIKNTLDCSLTFINDGAEHGSWEINPPNIIGAHTTSSQFQLKDHLGLNGSAGWVRYRVDLADAPDNASKPIVYVYFADPTGENDNEFEANATIKDGQFAQACYLFAFSNTDFPKRDHPLTGS
ncbi:hypothetical protein TWF481_005310 [Arthrobotrys musiformis]|uniref:Uncharacterized protein n=1 Tax=Arthrobotrys musiformis TaxID=47236 RepID=A0AAV9WDC7_9PEZI